MAENTKSRQPENGDNESTGRNVKDNSGYQKGSADRSSASSLDEKSSGMGRRDKSSGMATKDGLTGSDYDGQVTE